MKVSMAGVWGRGRLLLIPLLALSVAGAAACGGGEAKADGKSGAAKSSVSDAPITVIMKDNVFEPKDITVPVGKTVVITAKNTGTAVHNMQVLSKDVEGKNFESATMVNPGAESKFEVKFTKAGTFKVQCIYHLPDMVGSITAK